MTKNKKLKKRYKTLQQEANVDIIEEEEHQD